MQRLAEAENDRGGDVFEARDRLPVEGDDLVARLDARRGGGAAGRDDADHGRGQLLADGREQYGADDDGEEEIRHRPRHHDGRALPKPLVAEGDGPIGLGEGRLLLPAFSFLARHLAEHPDIAAEGQQADLPAGPGAIGPAEDLRAESDGEDLHPHAIPARDKVVAELVDEDENGQNAQERQPIVDQHSERIHRPTLFAPDAFTDRGGPSRPPTSVENRCPRLEPGLHSIAAAQSHSAH